MWNARRIAGEILRWWQSMHAVDVLLTFTDSFNVLFTPQNDTSVMLSIPELFLSIYL